MPFSGEPSGQTVAVVRTATETGSDDPLAGLLAVYWWTKGDASVVTIPTDVDGDDTTGRVLAYLELVQDWIDAARRRTRTERTPIPDTIHQPTFIEARFAGQALGDGPTQRYWEEAAGEVAMLHNVPDSPIQTKVRPSMSLEWLEKPASVETIKADLAIAGVPAIIAIHMALDMMAAIGWKPQSKAERAENRRIL